MIENSQKVLSIKQLASLIFPVFATNSLIIDLANQDSAYSCVPTNIIFLIKKYIDCCKNHEENINLIVDITDYSKDPFTWSNELSKELSESLKKDYKVDFKNEYIIVEYKKEELSYLEKLAPETLSQLINMKEWIIGKKMERKASEEYAEEAAKFEPVKPIVIKRIRSQEQ